MRKVVEGATFQHARAAAFFRQTQRHERSRATPKPDLDVKAGKRRF